jgi:hypothetical protein
MSMPSESFIAPSLLYFSASIETPALRVFPRSSSAAKARPKCSLTGCFASYDAIEGSELESASFKKRTRKKEKRRKKVHKKKGPSEGKETGGKNKGEGKENKGAKRQQGEC